MKKNEQEQIKLSIFNWGPCVTHFKCDDAFIDLLIKEGKKGKQDYRDKLAGQIKEEIGYSEQSKKLILPRLSQFIGVYDQAFERYQSKPYETKPEYVLSALWINYQKQHEYNPPHDHDGRLSFVIYLDMPKKLEEEQKNYVGKSCGPGGIQFLYGEGPRDAVTTLSFSPKKGDMFIFPSWLKHYVAPFKSDCTRISVSGNFHDQVPINNVINFAPKYLKNAKK
jgi:hypothetical protein|tara:strand:+ start:185 stop:853 length:669 start_codon:yes stop_codon:yes gene_type:complete